MDFKKILLGVLILYTISCSPKKINFAEQIIVEQSNPIELKSHQAEQKSVYVLARRDETNIKDLQKTMEQTLYQKGYTSAQSPSNATYIIHIAIPAMGTTNRASLQENLKDGYGKVAKFKSTGQDEEEHFAMLADVLVVARNVPEKIFKRSAVVSTTSKPSKITEDSTRLLVSIPKDEDYTFNDVRPFLVNSIAEKIAITLP